MIKLGRLRLKNFKSFGEPFFLDFSSSDVFIFDGPNGFGKTTLFDAVEICLTRKIGRVVNTDGKQKDTHLLKKDSKEVTEIFLELKSENITAAVIYLKIPPQTTKQQNKPTLFTLERMLLSEWPSQFNDDSEYSFDESLNLEDLLGNSELESTFDLFNYVQQEETCHFLKNKESERHGKISYLFGSIRQNEDRDKLNLIKKKINDRLNSLDKDITVLESEKVRVSESLGLLVDNNEDAQVMEPSGKLEFITNFIPTSNEQIGGARDALETLLWLTKNIDEYRNLEFNYFLDVLIEQREQALKDIMLSGHLNSYEEVQKADRHVLSLNKLELKINNFRSFLSLAENEHFDLPNLLEKISSYFPKEYLKHKDKLDDYFKASKEVGGYQKVLARLLESRKNLKTCFDSHISEMKSSKTNCPFCGDLKNSNEQLRLEYEKQSKVFEELQSDALSALNLLETDLRKNLVSKCAEKANRFIEKYIRLLDFKLGLEEVVLPRERWERMRKVIEWLNINEIEFSQFCKADSSVLLGEKGLYRIHEFKSSLRNVTKSMESEISFDEIKSILKSFDLSVVSNQVLNSKADQLTGSDVELDLKFLNLVKLKFNSDKLTALDERIKKLQTIHGTLSRKESTVKGIHSKYTKKIKEYEKSVAKQLAIPFYIYSSKILQTRPDGNGAFLQCAESTRDNGFIRFTSGLNDAHDAWNTMSSGQLSGLVISFMLAMNKVYPTQLKTLLIDDPVQTMDEMNLASFVQLLKYEFKDSQLILSTHERKVANFLAYKYQIQTEPKLVNMKKLKLEPSN
ncbi:AAA family ATPase [Pseudoalteromonas sp. Hal040]|uniref:AAA family ATPase n=1 Tax=unclassified Pseudoalteromonas TaxID=194690 RepID=UPI00301D2610